MNARMQAFIEYCDKLNCGRRSITDFDGGWFAALKECQANEEVLVKESARLDAIANGFSVWQTINLETNEEQWYCQYAIDGIVCGDSLRDALDKGIEANDKNQSSSG